MQDSTIPLGLGSRLRRLLAELDATVQAEYDRRGADFRPRFHPVARHLVASEAASIGALANIAGVSQPAITQTVREMQRAGLVSLAPGVDRRERLARLTPKGRALADELAPLWAAIEAAALRLEDEAGPLGRILDAAADALRREPFGSRIEKELQK